jgi:hypothetical protein
MLVYQRIYLGLSLILVYPLYISIHPPWFLGSVSSSRFGSGDDDPVVEDMSLGIITVEHCEHATGPT